MYQAYDLKMEVLSLMEAMEKFGKVFGKDAILDYSDDSIKSTALMPFRPKNRYA